MTRAHRSSERGSLAVELALVVPLLFLLIALVAAYGRVARVNGQLEAGTRDAARAASQARSAAGAEAAAEQAVLASLTGASAQCTDTLEVVLLGLFEAGQTVRVEASCSYPLDDLGLPGAPGDVEVSSTFSSPLDPNRGVR